VVLDLVGMLMPLVPLFVQIFIKTVGSYSVMARTSCSLGK
jgi:hypothetical protein